MRDIWGLIIALTGLFIVWLWATGRAEAVWQAVQNGATNQMKFDPNSVNLHPPNILNGVYQPNASGNTIQTTPFSLMGPIPQYIPSVGNSSFNIPGSLPGVP